jgi:hypothetical protein
MAKEPGPDTATTLTPSDSKSSDGEDEFPNGRLRVGNCVPSTHTSTLLIIIK